MIEKETEENTLVPEGNANPQKFQLLVDKFGVDKALEILAAEEISITGFGKDKFKVNRKSLGYTPKRIAGKLAQRENNRPKRY